MEFYYLVSQIAYVFNIVKEISTKNGKTPF